MRAVSGDIISETERTVDQAGAAAHGRATRNVESQVSLSDLLVDSPLCAPLRREDLGSLHFDPTLRTARSTTRRLHLRTAKPQENGRSLKAFARKAKWGSHMSVDRRFKSLFSLARVQGSTVRSTDRYDKRIKISELCA